MAESVLSDQLARERSEAIRHLLASPLLREAENPDGFRATARHRSWLAEWFESTCGWPLDVDVRAGWARLVKRGDHPDAERPARRRRGARQPFDRRRYELLCVACAELTRVPVTTIGILAGRLAATTAADERLRRFDSARRAERQAFIDALQWLERHGVLTFSGGDAESFVDRDDGNAMVWVDSSLLHQLLAAPVAPSALDAHDTPGEEACRRLSVEPRYGEAADAGASVEAELRNRWLRHSLARRLLDDPVLYVDELTESQRAYLANPSGRAWLLARAAEAGFVVEERAEGKLAVDPERLATDDLFPAPQDNAKQAALILTDLLARPAPDGRRLDTRSLDELAEALRVQLRAHPGWARQYRDEEGPARLAAEAVEVLARFGLAVVRDGVVQPRPALARYAARTALIRDRELPPVAGGDR